MNKLLNKLLKHFRKYRIRYSISMLFLLFFVAYFFNAIFIFVKPGEEAVLWKRFAGGTVVGKLYSEGTHVICPWDKMYVYNVRIQMVNDTLEVLTIDGLPITLELSIRYFPNRSLLSMLHKEIGPNYASIVLVPEVEHVVRSTVGQYRPEELYASQRLIVSKILEEAYLQTASNYITLEDLLIRRIILPEPIRLAIDRKLEAQQLAQEYDFRIEKEVKEAERKRIEAEGFNRYNSILTENLTPDVLKWQGVIATQNLASSPNAKVVIVGSGKDGLPIILGNQ